jgi:hypothetical protein
MWGWVAKAAGWAWAHKTEIGTAVQVWKALRNRRLLKQRGDETAKEYYKREGIDVLRENLGKLVEGNGE